MDPLDEKLLRVWELFDRDGSEEIERQIGELLPPLVEAGYAEESGHSPTGFFWNFTQAGVERYEELEN